MNLPRFKKAKRRAGQTSRGLMNKTEARYAEHLQSRLLDREILGWLYEPLKVRLGLDWKLTYTPDFLVQAADGELVLEDVKAGKRRAKGSPDFVAIWEDDARAKIQAAARLFPMFHWAAVWENRDTGEWLREEITR